MKSVNVPDARQRRLATALLSLGLAATTATLALSAKAEDQTFRSLAGTTVSSFDGQGSAARFVQPMSIALDDAGNVYVADDSVIRRISPSGVVTTLAGVAGLFGGNNGAGSDARFWGPAGVAVSSSGDVYVSDYHAIRKITPAGVVTTFAGIAGAEGSADGTGSGARFKSPRGVAIDQDGNLYVADASNHTIRKITPAGVVTTLAGLAGAYGSADGSGSSARFNNPSDVTVDSNGNVYVADSPNATVRKITPAGMVTTLAGLAGSTGSVDASGSNARFMSPLGLAVDGDGTVFVADQGNSTIRKISAAGAVSTLAGLALTPGLADGNGSAARFYHPADVAVDAGGDAYIADAMNRTVRKISAVGAVSTLAGSGYWTPTADGQGASARFSNPGGLAIDADGSILVADLYNHAVRRITSEGTVTTFAGQVGQSGFNDGLASVARFYLPSGIAIDASQNVYVSDWFAHTIRLISGGNVTTLAGSAGVSGSADGTGTAARFRQPRGIACDASGNVYVADSGNHTIRMVTPAGAVSTIAGLALSPGSADGTGSAARLRSPSGVALDPDGNLIVADNGNYTIRKVTPAGVVTTVAGSPGSFGSSDGEGSAARFGSLNGIEVGANGNAFVVDNGNKTIRMVTPSGNVTTIASVAYPGMLNNVRISREGTGSHMRFTMPTDVAVDAAGRLYVSDANPADVVLRGDTALSGAVSAANPPGFVGVSHQLNFSGAASGYQWRITRAPAGSTAQLSSPTAAAPTFTPDIAELYEFQLQATDGAGEFIGYVSLLPPTIELTAPVVLESDGSVTITFTLSEAMAETASVDWTTADSAAIAGLDYVAANGTVIFDPGETVKTVIVQILDDALHEDTEFFRVDLGNAINAIGRSRTIQIDNDDSPPTLSVAAAEAAEGHSGTTPLEFTVTLSAASARTLTANCSTPSGTGTATPGVDFVQNTGTQITFLPGETSKTVTIQLKGDTQPEQDETFSFWAGNSWSGPLQSVTTTGTILDDDTVTTPTGVVATAITPTSVAVSWTAVPNAVSYEVHRDDERAGYQFSQVVTGLTFTDTTVEAGRAYVYAVAASSSAGTWSSLSPWELATTVIFTDPALTPGVTRVKTAHISELRTAINAVRQLASLPPAVFTDPVLVANATRLRAVHLRELRTALNEARAARGFPPIAFDDATITEGVTKVRASHFEELRSGVR